MEFVIIFFWGWFAWFLTGTDDFLIFYSIYNNTNDSSNHKLAILGLISSVLLMIFITFTSNIIAMILPLIKQYTFIGGIVPIYLGIKTIISKQDEDSFDINKSSYFLLAFLGFLLNSGDDIIFNLSIILGKETLYQIFFFSGIFCGALTMIWIVTKLHRKVNNDYPIIRGIVLVVVGMLLFISGIN